MFLVTYLPCQKITAKCGILFVLKFIIFLKVLLIIGDFWQKQKKVSIVHLFLFFCRIYFIKAEIFCAKKKIKILLNVLSFILVTFSKSQKLSAKPNCFWEPGSRVPEFHHNFQLCTMGQRMPTICCT